MCSVADAATLDHARHDLLAVAAAVDRPRGPLPALTGSPRLACGECGRLHADLVALASALPTISTPARRRDFALTPVDAERLRARGPRAWLGRIGTARDTVTRPLAIGFTTLGLAGLLVTAAPPLMIGAGGTAGAGASAAPRLEMQPSTGDGGSLQVSGPDTSGAAPQPIDRADPPGPVAPTGDRLPVVALSGAFLAAGGGLFVVRRRARMR